MSALTSLAAAPDAIAPIAAAVLAFASFLVLLLLSFSDVPLAPTTKTVDAADSDQPREDRIGT